jgi:phosphopantothenoylcysteine decarboxylase/phosphopantothenate--cysteine ligase
MAAQVAALWPDNDMLFMVAAVADFVPRDPALHKLKKAEMGYALALTPSPDILTNCGKTKRADQVLVGFAVETRNDVAEARQKLVEKNLDLIVVNNPSTPGAGFDVDTNVVTLLTGDAVVALPLLSKAEVAKEIVKRVSELQSQVTKRTGDERS